MSTNQCFEPTLQHSPFPAFTMTLEDHLALLLYFTYLLTYLFNYFCSWWDRRNSHCSVFLSFL